MEDLDDLYATKRSLENRIENYFGGKTMHSGDYGYQELLVDLENIEEQIEEHEKE